MNPIIDYLKGYVRWEINKKEAIQGNLALG
jgi:hypothetical protein